MCHHLRMLLFIFGLAVSGCGQAAPEKVAATPNTVAKSTASTNDPKAVKTELTVTETVEPVSKVPMIATAVEGTAEATFQKTLIAFQEGRLDTAFDFLPASYQADVESVVHDFAEKMDAELWSKGFDLLSRIANILKTKKTLILSLDNIKRVNQIESIKPHWDTIASGINTVATSEVADVDKLKRSDVKGLLASASQLLNGLPLPKFGDVTVTTLNSNDDIATLSYRESKDGEAKQVEFVKVEGKWLPSSIANGWSAGIADVRLNLAGLQGRVSTLKPQVMQQFDLIGGMLDQVQQAKTSEEFNSAVAPLIFTVAIGAKMAENALQEAPHKSNPIHVVINREMSRDEQTKLKDAIIASFPDSSIQYEIIPNDGKTRFRFAPITDGKVVVAILEKHFAEAEVRLNTDTKTIHVELK